VPWENEAKKELTLFMRAACLSSARSRRAAARRTKRGELGRYEPPHSNRRYREFRVGDLDGGHTALVAI
jgi:hypothetical protein